MPLSFLCPQPPDNERVLTARGIIRLVQRTFPLCTLNDLRYGPENELVFVVRTRVDGGEDLSLHEVKVTLLGWQRQKHHRGLEESVEKARFRWTERTDYENEGWSTHDVFIASTRDEAVGWVSWLRSAALAGDEGRDILLSSLIAMPHTAKLVWTAPNWDYQQSVGGENRFSKGTLNSVHFEDDQTDNELLPLIFPHIGNEDFALAYGGGDVDVMARIEVAASQVLQELNGGQASPL